MCKGLDEFKPHLHYPGEVRAAMQRLAQLADVKVEDLLTISIYAGSKGLLQTLVEEYLCTDYLIAAKLLSTYSMLRSATAGQQPHINNVVTQLEHGLGIKRLDWF